MIRIKYIVPVLILLAVTGQAQPPAREGNVWGGFDHEPNPATVHQQERAAGVLPSNQREQRLNEEVEQTARQLLGPQSGTKAPDQ